MKQSYITPSVRKKVEMEIEQAILTGSVVTPTSTIETAGQKVEEHNFSESGFNTQWE